MATEQVINQQPGLPPTETPLCGLESLTNLETVLAEGIPEFDNSQIFKGDKTVIYKIYDQNQETIFYSFVNKGTTRRICCCCKTPKDFFVHLVDNSGKEVLTMETIMESSDHFISPKLYNIKSPFLGDLGMLESSEPLMTNVDYYVRDPNGTVVFEIRSKLMGKTIQITTAKNFAKVGEMGKPNVIRTMDLGKGEKSSFQVKLFYLTFPKYFDLKQKGLLLGVVLLLNFLEFEKAEALARQ